jgi:hypothetical protein
MKKVILFAIVVILGVGAVYSAHAIKIPPVGQDENMPGQGDSSDGMQGQSN